MSLSEAELKQLAANIKSWGSELGLADVRITDIDLSQHEAGLAAWLEAGMHGDMAYMATHGMLRARPAELVPGTIRVVSARIDYLSRQSKDDGAGGGWRQIERQRLAEPGAAVVALYARGRDYHKVLRRKLQQLATRIEQVSGSQNYRVFTDSAPVMEVALAQKAGLGWRGKHTLLLNREAGSLFFLGEILTDLPLPVDVPATAHCGECSTCIDVCPTQAIVAPYRLDARRCISYLTIELKEAIPVELRSLIGNRIYGCDDCQLFCPWNKFAQHTDLPDFQPRHHLDESDLVTLFEWTEAEFLQRTEGSAIRRIGHRSWRRNLAVGLGNALAAPNTSLTDREAIRTVLQRHAADPDELVREHILWALSCETECARVER